MNSRSAFQDAGSATSSGWRLTGPGSGLGAPAGRLPWAERIGKVAGDHARALGGELRRLGLALPAGGAGDDDHLVLYATAHSVTNPPSTRSAWPVTAAAASEAR